MTELERALRERLEHLNDYDNLICDKLIAVAVAGEKVILRDGPGGEYVCALELHEALADLRKHLGMKEGD